MICSSATFNMLITSIKRDLVLHSDVKVYRSDYKVRWAHTMIITGCSKWFELQRSPIITTNSSSLSALNLFCLPGELLSPLSDWNISDRTRLAFAARIQFSETECHSRGVINKGSLKANTLLSVPQIALLWISWTLNCKLHSYSWAMGFQYQY